MQFFKVYPIEGPQGRIIEGTDEGVIREENNKKNDDDDKSRGWSDGVPGCVEVEPSVRIPQPEIEFVLISARGERFEYSRFIE